MIDLVVGVLIVIAVAGGATIAVKAIINSQTIKAKARSRTSFRNGLKLLIKSKQTRTVSVGIFDKYTDRHLQDMTIESKYGVSDSIYTGQILYT